MERPWESCPMPDAEESIVRRAQAGDRDAFRVLFERYRDPLYGYVRRMVGSDDLAADLTQDAFLRAYQSLSRLKSAGAFHTWLYQIATNRVRDHWKSPRREALSLEAAAEGGEQGIQPADPSPGPERVAVREGLRVAVASAVERLSPEHREVVLLHHIGGMDVRAIAGALGVAEGTVKSRLGRARADLRRRLAAWIEE